MIAAQIIHRNEMLTSVDLTLSMDRDEYLQSLPQLQQAAYALGVQVSIQKRVVIVVFEGWSASGKGGSIRRLTEKLDPRSYVVYSLGSQNGDDSNRHYLWRYWRRLPEAGQIAIFDQSWYQRVLVDRVEGNCSADEWRRAYREINQFEGQLLDAGIILIKYWMHIDAEEQLQRFKERETDKLQRWKLSEDDWHQREKWSLYEDVINEMMLKTSNSISPWTIVEGNSKYHARIKVLDTFIDKLSQELNFDPSMWKISADKGKIRSLKGKKDKKKKKKKKN